MLKETNHWCCLTFPNYTAGSTGAMWVKFLLKETTTTNSIIWESNLDLMDHRPIPNQCMLLPHKPTPLATLSGGIAMCQVQCVEIVIGTVGIIGCNNSHSSTLEVTYGNCISDVSVGSSIFHRLVYIRMI